MHSIVYTKRDGGVAICHPVWQDVRPMMLGGLWRNVGRGFIDRQIAAHESSGIPTDAAMRFVHAVAFGGCSYQETMAILRDKDCAPNGTACELVDQTDLPRDRRLRDAWRRSPNGGPIYIDMGLARPIHWARIREWLRWNEDQLTPVTVDVSAVRDAVRRAADPNELVRVWPEGLYSTNVRHY